MSDACARLSLGVKLIQNLYADKLMEEGFGRKTFHLASNCLPFYSQLPVGDAKRMNQHDLWNFFAREVIANETNDGEHVKFIGFIGCTEYQGIVDGDFSHENIKTKTVANAALGGGDFALFGTGCLYTWPARIVDVMRCFESTQPVDLKRYLDDSNSRRTFGGCFATTLGSVCHEVGHIFDLGHNENGIMGSGIDFVHRYFTVRSQTEDLPKRLTGGLVPKKVGDPRLTKLKHSNKFLDLFHGQKGKDLTYFERNAAITLAFHKWFNQFSDSKAGDISMVKRGDKERVIVSKGTPLRLVEFRDSVNALMISYHSLLDENIFEFAIPDDVVAGSCVVFVIDDRGNVFKF